MSRQKSPNLPPNFPLYFIFKLKNNILKTQEKEVMLRVKTCLYQISSTFSVCRKIKGENFDTVLDDLLTRKSSIFFHYKQLQSLSRSKKSKILGNNRKNKKRYSSWLIFHAMLNTCHFQWNFVQVNFYHGRSRGFSHSTSQIVMSEFCFLWSSGATLIRPPLDHQRTSKSH